MRAAFRASFGLASLLAVAGPASGDAAAPRQLDHPREVALIQGPDGWQYRHFPSDLRLYVFDRDLPGKSRCNLGCDGPWQPLLPGDGDKPVGAWAILLREDGRKQWAYQGHPVYLRYHDSAETPTGEGIDHAWHFLQP